jgi:hypothetical protein
MLHKYVTTLRYATVIALIVFCLPFVANAGTINIILSELDMTYLGSAPGGGSLFDSIAQVGGSFTPALADSIETAVFELDNNLQGTIQNNHGNNILYGDVRIDGIGASISTDNTLKTNLGNAAFAYGIDWFTSAGAGGNNLKLQVAKIDMLLTNGVMFFTGKANVVGQNLPFGLAFDTNQQVTFSYTATLPGIAGGGESTGSAISSGAMTISGPTAPPIPEPTSVALLCTGGLTLGLAVVRRQSKGRAA